MVRRYFATKEEAALCYSRLRASCVGKEALEAEATAGNRLLLLAGVLNRGDVNMTAEEAMAAAEAEGLPLLINSSGSKSGFKHVFQGHKQLRRSWRLEEEGTFLGCGCLGKRA